MIKITTWKPDTCDCEIEYEWDDSLPEDQRVHIPKTLKACPAHQGLVKNTHWNKVLDENTRKNKVFGTIIENFPTLTEEITQEDGSVVKRLKKGIDYKWSFDANRVLEVQLTGTNTAQKTSLQELSDTLLGAGKVKVI